MHAPGIRTASLPKILSWMKKGKLRLRKKNQAEKPVLAVVTTWSLKLEDSAGSWLALITPTVKPPNRFQQALHALRKTVAVIYLKDNQEREKYFSAAQNILNANFRFGTDLIRRRALSVLIHILSRVIRRKKELF